ncbi:MAG: putative rane protein [Frankiales bacterium]|nr:putative rane protein [Frankiales bacterium]
MRLPLLDAMAALIVVAIMRKGAFYPPDDLRLPAIAVALGVIAVALTWRQRPLQLRDVVVIGALLGFSVWWYVDAHQRGQWPLARQVVGSALGFAACYALGRTLDDASRRVLRSGAIVVGALVSSVGLVGLALRSQPLALPAQNHLRLAGTLTYSNATGALLAMLLVVAVSCPASRFRDAQLVLITGGLLATQSRGALLAVLIGLLLTWRHLRAAVVPLALGLFLGAIAVAGSGAHDRQWLLIAAAVALPAAALVRIPPIPGRWLAVAGALIGLVVVAVAVTSNSLSDVAKSRSGTASVSDRSYEWRAGWADFRGAPLVGAGPGNRLHLSDGRSARFVHNEPLQVAADSGLVGVALITVAFAASLVRRRGQRRVEPGSAVLSAFAVCALLDFPWHLPAIPMTAGLLLAGLPYATSNTSPRAATQRSARGAAPL